MVNQYPVQIVLAERCTRLEALERIHHSVTLIQKQIYLETYGAHLEADRKILTKQALLETLDAMAVDDDVDLNQTIGAMPRSSNHCLHLSFGEDNDSYLQF